MLFMRSVTSTLSCEVFGVVLKFIVVVFQTQKLINKFTKTTLVIVSTGTVLNPVFANDSLEKFGDTMQFLLPLTAYGATFIYDDPEGRMQFYKHGATALTVTTVAKGIFQKTRPNDSPSKTSFPSGHTNGAFIGATFLNTRYGAAWGVPAYTAAVVTAYSRIDADAHYLDDVIAGASVAFFSNLFWLTPHDSAISIAPMVSGDAKGVAIRFSDRKSKPSTIDKGKKPKYRYSFNFGPAYLKKNEFRSPSDNGATFDLYDFDKTSNPQTTAVPVIEWYLNNKHTVAVSLAPYEARDNGSFKQQTSFGGVTFPANTKIRSAYRMNEWQVQYDYNLLKSKSFSVKTGASIINTRTVLELKTDEGPLISSKVDDRVTLPLLHLGFEYQFSRRWSLQADISAISLSDDKQVDGSILVAYEFDQHWDTAFGYSYYDREINTSELYNSASYDILTLVVGYRFYGK